MNQSDVLKTIETLIVSIEGHDKTTQQVVPQALNHFVSRQVVFKEERRFEFSMMIHSLKEIYPDIAWSHYVEETPNRHDGHAWFTAFIYGDKKPSEQPKTAMLLAYTVRFPVDDNPETDEISEDCYVLCENNQDAYVKLLSAMVRENVTMWVISKPMDASDPQWLDEKMAIQGAGVDYPASGSIEYVKNSQITVHERLSNGTMDHLRLFANRDITTKMVQSVGDTAPEHHQRTVLAMYDLGWLRHDGVVRVDTTLIPQLRKFVAQKYDGAMPMPDQPVFEWVVGQHLKVLLNYHGLEGTRVITFRSLVNRTLEQLSTGHTVPYPLRKDEILLSLYNTGHVELVDPLEKDLIRHLDAQTKCRGYFSSSPTDK